MGLIPNDICLKSKMETKTQQEGGITRRKSTQYTKFCPKEERNASLKKVSSILQKAEHERTLDEQQLLGQYSEVVAVLKLRQQRRDEAKKRLQEVEEPMNVLQEKCEILARAIANSEHLVVYTGAGISTAARIPDYRGSNGIWTRLQQGKDIGNHDLSLAEPTFTHMALAQLYRNNILKYIVSQNCDGLHLRSGLPRSALSELHGNMYIEVCKNCKPAREYWRLFDVTENTARYSHRTMRRCYICSHELVDTIVHFGERGTLQWPLNWSGACKNADAADTILCLGSSLKVLKRYPWLWQMSKPVKKRPNLYIVNLQWTPKDDCAVMKINGKCDTIMKIIMKYLCIDVPTYYREKDPIFAHATYLCDLETHTTTQPCLKKNDTEIKTEINENNNKNQLVDNEMQATVKKCVDDELEEETIGKNEMNYGEIQSNNGRIKTPPETSKKQTLKNSYKKIIQETNQNNNKRIIENILLKEEVFNNVGSIQDTNKNNIKIGNNLLKVESMEEYKISSSQNDSETRNKLKNELKEEPLNECEMTSENAQGDKQLNENEQGISKDFLDKENVSSSSINMIPEQIYAYDLTINKRNSELEINKYTNTENLNCDNLSYTSIKTSRISQLYGSSSNCTLSEQNNTILPRRKSHFVQSLSTELPSFTKQNANLFSIDNILKKTEPEPFISNNTIGQNMQTIMAYYELANTVLHNQMFGYLNAGLYPYQTSFLYSGLHSIINPVPYFTYDFDCKNVTTTSNEKNDSKKQITAKIESEIPKDVKTRARCLFCVEIFNSHTCLYYVRTESVFVKKIERFSKSKNSNKILVCVCCDYTTEEDSDSDENKSYAKVKKKQKRLNKSDTEKNLQDAGNDNEYISDNIDENVKVECSSNNKNEKVEVKNKVQAGWFGKGYRKNRRPKKK